MESITDAKILIIDDEPTNVLLLQTILTEACYVNVFSSSDSMQAIPLFNTVEPDILLLDLFMPNIDGLTILRRLSPEVRGSVPILVLTADATLRAKHEALAEGADDFLTKPFDHTEVLLRIRNLLRSRLANVYLEDAVAARTAELKSAQLDTLQRLALAAEYRDDQTGRHAERVGASCGVILEHLRDESIEPQLLVTAATLHDVGKIGVPDDILLKPGPLSREQFEIMKDHTSIGARILSGSNSPLLRLAESIAHYHHERWDGGGYWGLKGEEIPLEARIVTVADSFDAMTHNRPYKAAISVEEALGEIQSLAGRQFDPKVADAFLSARAFKVITG
jgi:putative two-component system response regulator